MKLRIAAAIACSQLVSPALAWAGSSVQRTAASLPASMNVQQAEANRRALAPVVAQAVAEGRAAEVLAAAQGNRDVAAAALPYAGHDREGSPPSPYSPPAHVARRRAHAAGCYGAVWMQQNWDFGGGVIGWLYERDNGWCGSAGRITWPGGATFAAWSWGPYCWAGKGADYSWDLYPSWIHTAHWGSLGVSYPWGCWGLRGGKVQIRTAWNGYFDYYNDYGF